MIIDCSHFQELASDVQIICKPLQKIGITYLSFMRNYYDGNQIYLSNNSAWIDTYFKHKLYESSLFEASPSQYNSSHYLWPENCNSEVFRIGRENFDSYHGITFIEKNKQFCDFYFISGPKSNGWLRYLFLNNTSLFKAFISHYKSQMATTLRNLNIYTINNKNRYDIVRDLSLVSPVFPPQLNKRLDDFYQSLNINNFDNGQLSFSKLPPKEKECLYYLLQGKTAKQTAKILALSHRTIETYLDNIRRKTKCSNKLELINKARHLIETAEFL